jgi:hypothetical protein
MYEINAPLFLKGLRSSMVFKKEVPERIDETKYSEEKLNLNLNFSRKEHPFQMSTGLKLYRKNDKLTALKY